MKKLEKIKNETFNIEKAINRLQWRFKNDNIKVNESKIIINELDIKAIDFLINWVNQQKKESLQENELFAKIYCYALSNELEFYKDIKLSNKKLQEQLKIPIEYHYQTVLENLNRNELNKFMNKIGLEIDHTKSFLQNETHKNEEKIIITKNKNEIQSYIIGKWDFKAICKALNNQITECINKYK